MTPGPAIITLHDPVGDGDHTLGPGDAPITIVEYGDFECPDCARAYPVIKQIQKRLGTQMRLVFRHFPLMRAHPRALRAAEAAEAAAAQNKFWEMHDLLFKNQLALEDHHLSKYARKLGLDTARFDSEMNARLYVDRIQEGYYHSLYAGGISGTPTFFINGRRHNDSFDLERMMAAINRTIAEGSVDSG